MRISNVTGLLDKFEQTDGCWEWTGGKRRGYGQFRNRQAHRVVYEHFVGPIPNGFVLDHLCRNPGCVRPDHLEVVTQQENVQRAFADRTACPQGHPYTAENTRVGKHGKHCRVCDRERARERRAA